MVHRSADSRLLANLISHEKDYSKHLQDLLDTSHASFTSLTAYASSSPPPASQVILAVASSLSSVDDALRGYAVAVEEWSRHLKSLKDLEDEVGNIMRDREILVTRLLKASKSASKPSNNRESFIFPTSQSMPTNHPQASGSTSTLSARSSEDPSTSYATATSPSLFASLGSGPIAANKKMQAAQSELQACEAHLAIKEQELDNRRSGAIRDGLRIRFRALAECGTRWTEVGKEVEVVLGLGIEDRGSSLIRRPSLVSSPSSTNKPLPELHAPIPVHAGSPTTAFPDRPSSDLSSIAPSQSASQVNLIPPSTAQHIYSELEATSSTAQFHSMTIPPAHAIAEVGLPTSTPTSPRALSPIDNSSAPGPSASTSATSSMLQRHVLPHRITEEDLGFRAGSLASPTTPGAPNGHLPESNQEPDSSDNEITAENEVRVVENPRFTTSSRSTLDISKPTKGKNATSPTASGSGFLGSIRGLFTRGGRGTGDRDPDGDDDSLPDTSRPKRASKTRKGLGLGRNKGWDMRTEKNIKKLGRDASASDGEDGSTMSSPPAPLKVSIPPSPTRTKFLGSSLSAGAVPSGSSQALPRGRAASDVGSRRLRKGVGVGARGKTASSDLPAGEVRKRRRSASLDHALKAIEESGTPTPTNRSRTDVRIVDLSNRLSRAEEWVDEQTSGLQNHGNQADEKAWSSDIATGSATPDAGGVTKKASVKRKKSNRRSMPASVSTSALPLPTVVSTTPTPTAADLIAVPSASSPNLSRPASLISSSSASPTTASRGATGRTALTQSASLVSALPTHAPTTPHTHASATKPRSGSLDENFGSKGSGSGLASSSDAAVSTTKAQRRASSPVSIVPAGALSVGEGSVSLMSIVEDVAKANREAWGSSGGSGTGGTMRSVGGSVKPAGMMEVVKAPHSFSKKELMNVDLEEVVGHTNTGSHSVSRSGSINSGSKAPAFEIPRAPGSVFDRDTKGEMSSQNHTPSVTPAISVMPAKPSRPAQSPLKSALRNPSRTPSPMLPLPPKVEPPTEPLQNGDAKGKSKAAPTPLHPTPLHQETGHIGNEDDAASISSYETGRELFDDDGNTTETERRPPTPPPHDDASHIHPHPSVIDKLIQSEHHRGGSDVSASTASTETPQNQNTSGAPRRRKSVRVSLQPTFSATPPAIEDDDDEPGWESSWKASSSANETAVDDRARDLWADSSDEDVEYQRARRLLSKFSRKEKAKKGDAHR